MIWPDGTGDWFFFILRFKWHIVLLLAIFALNILVLLLARRFLNLQFRSLWWLPTIAAFVSVFVSVGANAKSAMLITLLGSENDILAERAYHQFSKEVCIEKLVLLIQDGSETDNTRFYLSRMLGERLRNASSDELEFHLNQIQSLPIIKPEFIAPNALNAQAKQKLRNKHPSDIVQYYAVPKNSSVGIGVIQKAPIKTGIE